MARPRVTPWKEISQLVSIRDQFYRKSSDGEDCRAKACSLVWVWKVRGNLPHAVEATALLTDAILHDDPRKNSIFSIRAAYSLAFCRFVTGLVDSKLHGRKQSMYQKAMAVGVPASFVELRHEATHRDLPSLVVLRDAAQRSMEWLWEFYWAKIGVECRCIREASPAPNGEDMENEDMWDLRTTVTIILKPLIDLINESVRGSRSGTRAKLQLGVKENSIQDLSALCRRERAAEALLADSLLDPDLDTLVSCIGRDEEEEVLQPLFNAWDEVLRELCRSHPPFITTLVEAMVSILVSANTKGSNNGRSQAREGLDNNSYEEDVFAWLEHIFTAGEWATICNRYLILSHAEALCSASGTSAGFWAKQIYDLLSRQQTTPAWSRPTPEKMEIDPSHPSTVPGTSTNPDSDIAVLQSYGWDFGQKITYKPIGTV